MCPPEHFGVLYEINPWMHAEVAVDRDVAREQWETLAANLRAAGADIELQKPHDGVPDLVFTANAGIVNGRQFVVIGAGGGKYGLPPGGTYTAFALPDDAVAATNVPR